MDLLVTVALLLCVVVSFFSFWSGIVVGFFLGLWYAQFYVDSAPTDGSREWRAFRRWHVWRLLQSWFMFDVHYDDEEGVLNANARAYVCAVHPHGLWPVSGLLGFGVHGGLLSDFEDRTGKRLYLGVTRLVFWVPFLRDVWLWMGCVDASRATIEKVLSEGNHIGLSPGGVQEMALSRHDRVEIYTHHTGFARIAWEQKSPLIPIYLSGENRIYYTCTWLNDLCQPLRLWTARRLGYPLPSFFIPFPRPVHLVAYVGRRIDTEKCESLDDVLCQYYTEMIRLMQRYEDPACPLGESVRETCERFNIPFSCKKQE